MVVVPVPGTAVIWNDGFHPYAVAWMRQQRDRLEALEVIQSRTGEERRRSTPRRDCEERPDAIDEIPRHRRVGIDRGRQRQSGSGHEARRERALRLGSERNQRGRDQTTADRRRKGADHCLVK